MATYINELVDTLSTLTEYQSTLTPMGNEEYTFFIKEAIKELYIDTNRPSSFNKDMFAIDEDGNPIFTQDLNIIEERYVIVCAQIGFYRKVQKEKDDVVSWSTDAMTVTNADKPFANIQASINDLENERRKLFYKMTRYSLEG